MTLWKTEKFIAGVSESLGPTRITITPRGVEGGEERSVEKFLIENSGQWKVISALPNILILEREKAIIDGNESRNHVLISGKIKEEGWLGEIIGFILTSRWTGILTVTSGNIFRRLFFDKGNLRLASSNHKTEHLGEIMVKKGLITKQQLDEALTLVTPQIRIGEILVRKGFCSTSDVFKMISYQIEEIFFSIVLMSEGYYYFTEGIEPVELPAIFSFDTSALLLESAKRIDEISYFKKKIPDLNIVLKRNYKSFPPKETGMEEKFLGKCDGIKTLKEIACEMCITDFEVMKLAYHAMEKGDVEAVLTDSDYLRSLFHAIETFNEIINMIYSEISDLNQKKNLLEIQQNYLNNAIAEGDIPAGIKLEESGGIDKTSVLEVFGKRGNEKKLITFKQIMTRYTFFILFAASNYLPKQRHRQLTWAVHTMVQKVAS